MVRKRLLAGIKMILVSTILFFCLFLHSASSTEGLLDQAIEPGYPDSLDNLLEFHETFPRPAIQDAKMPDFQNDDIFDSNATKPEANISSIQLDPEIIFGKDGKSVEYDLKGMVVINGEERRTVVCSDQLGGAPADVNAMNIEVAHITVIAINFARGGNAIATSEIFLQPSQNNGAADGSDIG
jgi:hypothetical protein